ncbi:MAG: septal ring lytic transglycosylase RlpA family protein [Magnetococcus sp. WYHC-3]
MKGSGLKRLSLWAAGGVVLGILSGCATVPPEMVTTSPGVKPPAAARGSNRTACPYSIAGVVYRPMESAEGYLREGMASWYGPGFHGKRTATGELYDMDGVSAAHPTLPLPSTVRVTNLENGRELVVRVNDRGPFHAKRLIDLSRGAAEQLGFRQRGTAQVRVEALGPGGDGRPAGQCPEIRDRALSGAPSNNSGAARYFAQVGAFRDRDNARTLARSLGDVGRTDVQPARIEGREFFRVLVGPFDTHARAEQMVERLDGRGYSGGRVVVE